MNIGQKVRHQLQHGSVWQDRDSVDNYDGVVRALQDGSEDRAKLIEGLAACLTDADVLVRTGAVAALPEVAVEVGSMRLCNLLQQHLDLFRGVPPSIRLSIADLEEGVAQCIAKAAYPTDAMAIAYLRIAVRRPWGNCLLFRLAAIDAEWLLEHAAALVPKNYFGVLIPLSPADRRRLIAAVRPFEGKPTEYFWKQFPDAEAAELKQLLSES
jgi:hypothetical protein